MLASVRRQGRVSEVIVNRIKDQISKGRLPVGHKLPAEREMARQFKTSRVSVREAYRSLEELAVLRSLSLVLGLGKTSHKQLPEARMLIEPPIAQLAALRARKDDIVRLEAVLVREEADAARRTGPFRPTDSQFHRSVADCARNLPLIVLMNALADLTASTASALDSSVRARHRLKNCQFHRLIFEAIRRGDGDAAYTIMAEHVGDIQKRVHQCLTASRGNGPRSS